MVKKCPADNKQFATSGGVTRPIVCAEHHLLALVQVFVIPPPAASCHHVIGKRRTEQRDTEARKLKFCNIKNRRIWK